MIQEMKLQSVGIYSLRGMYQNDVDFHEVFAIGEQSHGFFHIEYANYVL